MRKVFLLLFIVLITGCSTEKLEPKTFAEIYSGNLSAVTKIEIRHGGGELKTIVDEEVIQRWLDDIQMITFVPDENQEGRVGYLYYVKLFEGETLTFSFDTSSIGDFYFLSNDELNERLEWLFTN
ncbi:hypothetical protein DS745_03660 [Anaerobacillus alkaliphilus]|uniref:Lipoprotein n=1 Tax=Anaerobacillus alkaliphilus TaxID=1548597 RepID=A0A4Q0VYE9_9BACI|nr:hypothetical protein [Anaerobacillus alkaliphilus]RXJ04490.1 hypothetical protein DS745_03660 [Anaerobacillus alkaliphilus]